MGKTVIRHPSDIVPLHLQEQITALTQGPIWRYGKRSHGSNDRYAFWCAHFADPGSRNRESCESELYGNKAAAPIADLWNILKVGPLRGHEPVRVYANAHTYGVEGYVHTDSSDAENYFSTIYYAHPVWHKNWGGETVFYEDHGNVIFDSVFPEPGTAITFPGSVSHCAKGPTRDCIDLRVTVVIKTQLRSSHD
jgi:SM-20-related protein